MRFWWMVLILAGLGACAAPAVDVVSQRLSTQAVPELMADPDPGLALPARIALIRIAGTGVTAVPAREAVLWRAAEQRLNRQLPAILRLVPLVDPESRLPLAAEGASPDAGVQLDVALSEAAIQGFDAVLVYQLAVAVSADPVKAAIRNLPLIGGVVPRTVATEGQGVGTASLIAPRSGTLLTQAEVLMGRRYVASMDVTQGRGTTAVPIAEFALLNDLIPRAEDAVLVLLHATAVGS